MRASTDLLIHGATPGAAAGLVAGAVFGLAMLDIGLLPTIAQLVREDSDAVGFLVHMAVAVILGSGFGVLVWRQRPGVGETLFWGLAYGAFWWYLGPLTLLPLFSGDGLTWDLFSAQESLQALLGHLLYGASAGLSIVFFQWALGARERFFTIGRDSILRGSAAGIASASLLGACLAAQDRLLSSAGLSDGDSQGYAWLVTLLIGVVAGVGFGVLSRTPSDGAGTGLIRGAIYGFILWLVIQLSLIPLIKGEGLAWDLNAVQENFVTYAGYILFGAGIALFYEWFGGLGRLLFGDIAAGTEQEGVGTQGLRILGRTLIGGLIGGLLFSVVMWQIDFLPSVASLVGAESEVAGFFVHMGISQVVGASYGLLFQRQSYGLGSALGWGVSYGFFWTILGPLTLAPIFLGSTPQWTVEALGQVFPNLIGHLIYGGGLGVTFYLLEARYSPWWVTRTQTQTDLVARRREQALSAGPALWTAVILIGLILPVLLGQAPEGGPAYG